MRCDVFKRTTDQWYPSYQIERDGPMLVEVSFTQTGPYPPTSGEWRVCVWGADDCGMERDFTDESSAWTTFLEVIGMEDVTMAALQNLGFVSA